MIDYYIEERPEDIPFYIGCSYVLPSNLVDNFGVVTLPITSPKHLPIGQLKGVFCKFFQDVVNFLAIVTFEICEYLLDQIDYWMLK